MRVTALGFLPWMVVAVGWAQGRPAAVSYSHLGSFDQGVARLGDECFVPVALVSRWGWQVRFTEGEADIQAEGRLVRVVARQHEGQTVIPLVQALQQLGARFDWTDTTTLTVRSAIRTVEIDQSTLRIGGTIAFSPRLARSEATGRLSIDLVGAWLDPRSKFDLPKGITVGQFDRDTVRLTIERPGVDGAILPSMSPGRSMELRLEGVVLRESGPKPVEVSRSGPQERPDPASTAPRRDPDLDPPPTESPVDPAPPTLVLGPPSFADATERGAVLVVPIQGPVTSRPTAMYRGPKTIELTIPGATAPEPSGATNAFVSGLTLADDGKGNARVVLTLKRAMAFELGISDQAVRLRLVKPKSEGKLAGKVVVVDAGHGGHDSGARGGKDRTTLEKDLTLKIAKLVAQELTAQGASVIMTRSDDTFIPLRERPGIANRAGADFFVSVHINSNTVDNKTSGQITFYHMQDPMGILLAECIQSELAKVSGLPSLGTWSDSRIYKNGGFAVLKHATMPAVLLELGFINHDVDRRVMQTAKFQQSTAQAVVRGLKAFLGGSGGQ